MNNIKDFLKNAAGWLVGAVPTGIRYGKPYRETLGTLNQMEFWSEARLRQYQICRLRDLLAHAVKTVPFYQDLYRKGLIDSNSNDGLVGLRRLPMVDKRLMRQNTDAFISSAFPRDRLRSATTGGSSGEPFRFYTTKEEAAKEWAFVVNLWSRVGFKPKDRRLVLRGERVGQGQQVAPWTWRPQSHELVLSSYHLTEKSVNDYHTLALDSGCRFLHCHPSSAYVFAQLLRQHGLALKLKAVLASSERVFPFQRKLMEEVFCCRVYSFYGQSEHVCIAGECENSICYHVQPEYGITEVLDEHGDELCDEGATGEIVATGFLNYAMPFIRYRTGDRAVITNQKCNCGRKHPIFSLIDGRDYDYVVASNRQKVSTTALIFGQHFAAFARIQRLQIVQVTPGVIALRIIRNGNFSSSDETEIRDGIGGVLGDALKVSFQYVDEIPLSATGKQRFMIQNLDLGLFRSEGGPEF